MLREPRGDLLSPVGARRADFAAASEAFGNDVADEG